MQGIPAHLAARGLARSMDDRQRAVFAALASHPDAAALIAEAADESRRFRNFGHARLDDEDVILLSTLDYALKHCHLDCSKLVDGILERWGDMSNDMQSRISGRIDNAIDAEEPGVGVALDKWQSVLDRAMGVSPAMR